MTEIVDTDNTGRIYQVNNLLTNDEVSVIMNTDWLSLPWERGKGQLHWLRRWLKSCDHIDKLSGYVDSKLNLINQLTGKNFQLMSTQWWVDEPGFTVGMHTDGHLPYTMQLYWDTPSEEYGTVFYYYKSVDSLRYKFLSVPNHGYLMDNHYENDFQLLHWHSMLNKVPEGKIRVSSYTWFA